MFWKRIYRKICGELKYAKKQGLKCGKNVTVMGNVNFGSEPYLITIEDDVRISFDVVFINHDGGTFSFRHLDKYKEVTSFGKIIIGSRSFIGARSIIMPGVRIGKNCVIGAGSVVTKSVPDNSVAVGVPAKVISTVEQYAEKKLKMMPLGWEPEKYHLRKKEYLIKCIDEPK